MASGQVSTGKTGVSWLVLLATLVTVLIFARLGFWQLSRAEEKVDMLNAAAQAKTLPPLKTLDSIDNDSEYRQVELTGVFDFGRQFMRDNIVLNGQPGFEVLTPFSINPEFNSSGEIDSGQNNSGKNNSGAGNSAAATILVNRGWVPLGPDRQQRPDVSAIVHPEGRADEPQVVNGLIAQPSRGFPLGEAIDATENKWPLVIQYLDYETLSERLDTISLLPAVVVLAENHPQALRYSWKPVADGPEKHYGYAFQWFAMLVAVVILFIYLNFIKKHEPNIA